MLFGAFLMKNIFIIYPTHILNYVFCMISSKNPILFMLFQAKLTIMYDYIRQNLWKVLDFLMKSCKKYSSKYELEKWWKYFSSEMHQTTLPGHWKCFHFMPVTRSHWSLWKKTSFFMFVDYYRDSNSKCMHYIIALQKRVSFVRARSRK